MNEYDLNKNLSDSAHNLICNLFMYKHADSLEAKARYSEYLIKSIAGLKADLYFFEEYLRSKEETDTAAGKLINHRKKDFSA